MKILKHKFCVILSEILQRINSIDCDNIPRMAHTRWIKLERRSDREHFRSWYIYVAYLASILPFPSSLCDALFCKRDRYGEEWVKEVKPSFFFLLVATPFIRKTGGKEAGEEHRSRRESLKYFDSGMRAIEIFLKGFANFPCLLTFLYCIFTLACKSIIWNYISL